MPTLSAIAVVFALLIALAYVLRWRYRTWFFLLLASVLLAAAGQYWAGGFARRAAAPAQGQAEAARLRARPWPSSLDEQARLAPSFRGVDAVQEAETLALVYRVAVLRAMVGDAPLAFTTVADALAWREALGSYGSNAHRKQWQDISDLSDRALATLIDVTLPDTPVPAASSATPEWPPALQWSAPLRPVSHYIGNGLWIASKGNGSGENVVQFPIQVTRKGEGRIIDAQVSLGFYQPREGAPPQTTRPLLQERFACWVLLRDMPPGESRLLKCEVDTLHEQSPQTQRLIANIAKWRAGQLALWPGLTVGLDYEGLSAPQALPLNAEAISLHARLKAADAQSARQARGWRSALQAWMLMAGVALLGFAVPGARGHAMPAGAVLGQAAAVGALALAGTWFFMSRVGPMSGYAPLVVLLIAAAADAVFIGGVLLGNVVLARSRHPDGTSQGTH